MVSSIALYCALSLIISLFFYIKMCESIIGIFVNGDSILVKDMLIAILFFPSYMILLIVLALLSIFGLIAGFKSKRLSKILNTTMLKR